MCVHVFGCSHFCSQVHMNAHAKVILSIVLHCSPSSTWRRSTDECEALMPALNIQRLHWGDSGSSSWLVQDHCCVAMSTSLLCGHWGSKLQFLIFTHVWEMPYLLSYLPCHTNFFTYIHIHTRTCIHTHEHTHTQHVCIQEWRRNARQKSEDEWQNQVLSFHDVKWEDHNKVIRQESRCP